MIFQYYKAVYDTFWLTKHKDIGLLKHAMQKIYFIQQVPTIPKPK